MQTTNLTPRARESKAASARALSGIALLVTAIMIPVALAQSPAPRHLSADEIVEKLAPRPEVRTRSMGSRTLKVEPRQIDFQIGFDFDSAQIRSDSVGQLEDLARAMRADRLTTLRFRIEGHTDAAGTPAYNEDLSQRRARAVLDFLAARGVGFERLAAEGRGMRELLDTTNPLSAANRRVRVVARD